MDRRSFLRLSGVAGILAAQRAPAFAQGTKLHVVRWVDFIPEADVELKRQAPEASKALMEEAGLGREAATQAFLAGKQPTQRFVDPAHVAELVVFLCGDAGADITGATLPVEGGWLAG